MIMKVVTMTTMMFAAERIITMMKVTTMMEG